MYPSDPVQAVVRWLDEVVIGLNFCPFARKPFLAGAVRVVEVDAVEVDKIVEAVRVELDYLSEHENIETSILVLSQTLDNFFDYNDFIHELEDWLWQQGFEGIYQVASFHPDYCFADAQSEDVGNLTNRAPYPLLHILREDRLEQMLDRYPNADEIPGNNIRTLERLSLEQLRNLFPYLIARGQLSRGQLGEK